MSARWFLGIAIWRGCLVGLRTVEFAFSSVVFRYTRPYALFPVWHWRLTALLVAAYLVTGALAGAVAGCGLAFRRRAGSREDAAGQLESACGTDPGSSADLTNLLIGQQLRAGAASQLALGAFSSRPAGDRSQPDHGVEAWVAGESVDHLQAWLGAGLVFSILGAGSRRNSASGWIWPRRPWQVAWRLRPAALSCSGAWRSALLRQPMAPADFGGLLLRRRAAAGGVPGAFVRRHSRSGSGVGRTARLRRAPTWC